VCEVFERRVSDPKLVRLLMGVKASVARGRRITEGILRFTRHADPVKQPIAIDRYLSRLQPELRMLLGKDVKVHLNIADKPLEVLGDPAQLREVFTSLAMNARAAMPEGGNLTISVARHAGDEAPLASGDDVIHFQVADDGAGMSAEVRQRAFEPL